MRGIVRRRLRPYVDYFLYRYKSLRLPRVNSPMNVRIIFDWPVCGLEGLARLRYVLVLAAC